MEVGVMRVFPVLAAAGFGLLGLGLLGAPALAQRAAPFPAFEAISAVRSMGLQPLGRPMRRGPIFIVHAANPYGVEMRVVFDARDGAVVSARPVDPTIPPAPPPVADAFGGPPPDEFDETDIARREIPARPPKVILAPRKPPRHTASLVPVKTPVPRPRPATAPALTIPINPLE
jgi:hypothetical protein